MSNKATSFIAAVRDEADSFRHTYNPPEYKIEELSENRKTVTTNYLATIHSAINRSGLRLDDGQRHMFFSRVFGRKIKSAYEITNVEAVTFAKVCTSMSRDDLAFYISEVIS